MFRSQIDREISSALDMRPLPKEPEEEKKKKTKTMKGVVYNYQVRFDVNILFRMEGIVIWIETNFLCVLSLYFDGSYVLAPCDQYMAYLHYSGVVMLVLLGMLLCLAKGHSLSLHVSSQNVVMHNIEMPQIIKFSNIVESFVKFKQSHTHVWSRILYVMSTGFGEAFRSTA